MINYSDMVQLSPAKPDRSASSITIANDRSLGGDPLGFDAGDTDLYRYLRDSPTNHSDPNGERDKKMPTAKTDQAAADAKKVDNAIKGLEGRLGRSTAKTVNDDVGKLANDVKKLFDKEIKAINVDKKKAELWCATADVIRAKALLRLDKLQSIVDDKITRDPDPVKQAANQGGFGERERNHCGPSGQN